MNRTEALCNVLGWQGGTIHQVSQETGVETSTLLYGEATSTHCSDYTSGWFAARTCTLKYNQENIFPKYKGNADFWIGAADGYKIDKQ